jgi:hypothetical protein
MREIAIKFNIEYSPLLSKDLGAVCGLLFEIGIVRLVINENHDLILKQLEKRGTFLPTRPNVPYIVYSFFRPQMRL